MNKATHRQERRHWSISTPLVSALCALAVLFAAPAVSFSSSDNKLSTEDKELLAAGELVMKEKNEQRDAYKLFGGQSWQIVDVPVELAWQALKDLPQYKSFIPLATESDIKHEAGPEADLAMRQQWGPVDIRYVLQMTVQPERGAVMFRVDHSQNHDIRAGWGFMRVRPYKDNQTLVSFGALVDIGDGVFVSIIRPALRRDLLRIPFYFKRHIEGQGRDLYIKSTLQ